MRHDLPLRPVVSAIVAVCLLVGAMSPAVADRHCSYARESAFYARELSAEAAKNSVAACPAQTAEALDRLQSAMDELEICSCSYAEKPLRRWFESRSANGSGQRTDCRKGADTINAIAAKVLTEVEKCF